MSHDQLPTPDDAAAIRLAAAAPAIAGLRALVREAIENSTRDEVCVSLPGGSGEIAYAAVKAELEKRGWNVRRELSEKNESSMVLTPRITGGKDENLHVRHRVAAPGRRRPGAPHV